MLILKTRGIILLVIGMLFFIPVTIVFTQTDETPVEFEFAEENHQCFKCHGHKTYYFYNEYLGRKVKERMNPYLVIDSVKYYGSNHWNFSCLDCHSYDYREFPHPVDLRMEELPNCLDCHCGDEAFAQYHCEKIDEEFQKSVHSYKHSEDFTCWMCHDSHSYKINARTNENIKETIIYDNNICLSCHADIDKYQLISDNINPNVLVSHDWLPNQALHFASVRCIECHTEVNDTILVAHNVQPKEMAVKKCVECHSKNSLLIASLYKYQEREQRNKLGFFNAVILDDTYIIGANRNIYLNIISLVMFGMVIVGIGIHAFLRVLKK